MTFFNILRGLSSNLPNTKIDGSLYFCIDTGDVYFDYLDANNILQRTKINAGDLNSLQTQIDTRAPIISDTEPPVAGNYGRYWHDSANNYILYLNTGTKWELVPSTWG